MLIIFGGLDRNNNFLNDVGGIASKTAQQSCSTSVPSTSMK